MRSSLPMRCSATSGLQGRSNRTMRRQNSKFRPSPPHSVETRRLGPPDSRNWATSMSRRAEDSSSWNTPVATWARRLSSVRIHSSVSRWATKTSVFSPASRHRGACPASHAIRGSAASARSARRARAASSRPRRAWSAAPEASARRTRSAFCRRPRAWGAGAPRTASTSSSLAAQPPSPSVGRPTRGGSPPMSTRRVELVQGGRGSGRARRVSRVSVLREIGGAQQLEQAEEAVHVVVEGDRGEEQEVAAQGGDGRHRAPGRAARVAGRAAQAVGLVHHEEVDAGLGRAGRQLRPRDQRLQGDHGAPVDVERVEVGAVVPRDVGEPRLVEQHEDLVVLPPQLAQPLHGQRLGRDHQAPLRASRPEEAAQDEAGLDRLAQADLVGQEPAHGVGGGRPARPRGAGGGRAGCGRRGRSRGPRPPAARRGAGRRGAGRGPRRGPRPRWPGAPRGRTSRRSVRGRRGRGARGPPRRSPGAG